MRWLVAALVLACAPAVSVFAASAAAQTPEQAVAFLDHDKDGKVSLNEYLNFQLPNLAKNDLNSNGKLSRDEFKNSLADSAKKNAETSFKAFDADRNNGLDQREFLGYHAFVFKNYIDTDKDGFMSAAEWSALMKALN
jgi:hypothetical protein